MSRGLASVLCCWLSLILSSAAQADVSSPPKLRHAVFHMPPWSMQENEQFVGAHIEIIRELASRLSTELEWIDCPIDRCQVLLEAGEADIVIGLRPTNIRERYLRYLNPPFLQRGYPKVFYLRRESDHALNHYQDLYRYRIGVVRGSKLFDQFDQDRKLQIDYAEDVESNFRKLLLGRIDVVAVPEGRGEYALRLLNIRDQVQKAGFRVNDDTPRRIAISQRSPWHEHLSLLEKTLAEMVREKRIERIIEQHYLQPYGIARDAISLR